MRIGNIVLDNPTILAPLAGITNLPFRLMIKSSGCALVYSEMISSHGLVHGSRKTLQMLDSCPEEYPLAVQIFGTDPSIMAEAARIVEDTGAQVLDINFGCSVRKIVKTGAGVALMRTLDNAERILNAVRKAISIPMTIKIRSGWNASGTQAIDLSKMAEACGVDAIAVHPRTAKQGFSGKADWPLIAVVKNAVSIPVIGNGDVVCAEDGLRMIQDTGCDGVMIGRAAIGNPWIFQQLIAMLKKCKAETPLVADRIRVMQAYLKSSVAYLGEKRACHMMRSRLGWFVRGMRFSSQFRESIKMISSEEEALELIDQYQMRLRHTSV